MNSQQTDLFDRLPTMSQLKPLIAPFQKSDARHSVLQLINTLVPYFALWYLMIRAYEISFWLALPLIVLAAGFLIRVFIFFHDCGHNSFFPSTTWNKRVGFWLGVLTFTPSEQWWHSHAIHHATSGNLDKRGTGDVTTLTLEEYYDRELLQRLGYRFFRNPLVMFGLGPVFMFFLMHRFPRPRYGKRETASVIWSNLAILGIAVVMSLLVGWQTYLVLQLAVMWIAGSAGIYLFYIQHQFEESYWERNEQWNYVASALLGASYYRLPKVLQWFTGSIGFHHVHHLSPRIPNYNLEKCHEAIPEINQYARVIPFVDGFRTVRYKVWNESRRKMVGFPDSKVQEAANTVREPSKPIQ